MDSFQLKVITPAGIAVEAEVVSVTAPETAGEVTFLPGHVQFYGILGVGVLTYVSKSDPAKIDAAVTKLVITGGIAEFANGVLSILADSIDIVDQVNRDTYAAKRTEMQKTVDTSDSASPEWVYARNQLLRIEAIDQLLVH